MPQASPAHWSWPEPLLPSCTSAEKQGKLEGKQGFWRGLFPAVDCGVVPHLFELCPTSVLPALPVAVAPEQVSLDSQESTGSADTIGQEDVKFGWEQLEVLCSQEPFALS